MYFKQHHLISDGWSIILSGNKTLEYYLRLQNNENVEDIQEPSFLEYINTDKEYFFSTRYQKNKIFWQNKTETIPEFIYFKKKSLDISTCAQRRSFNLNEELSKKVYDFCEENQVSLLGLFTALFCIYINKTTTKRNIALGTTVLNRSNYKEKNTLGMFVNIIPLFFEINPEQDFCTFLKYILINWKTFLYHSHHPYELIVNDYRQKHNVIDELFDVSINYQNAVHQRPEGFKEIKSYWFPYRHQINSLNLNISNRINSSSFCIDYDYLIDLFTPDEIDQLHHHLIYILEEALDRPDKPISELELLPPCEKHQLIYNFNQNQTKYPHQYLHQMFEEQAARNPNNIALIYEDKHLTYRELDEKANQVAWMLREKGIDANDIVGILTSRSLEMFIGILGILKAGGAYLPIDPSLPRNRIRYILEDSQCPVLLTNLLFFTKMNTWRGEIVNFDSVFKSKNRYRPDFVSKPNDLAYIIYTSGSTGNPKGVMIEHRSIVNTISWRVNHYQFSPADVLLQIPPYSFDSSVEDIFSFLSAGGTIVIIDPEKRLDLMYLRELITAYHVTHFLATPLLYNAMLDDIAEDLTQMTSITVAGESIPLNLVKSHFRKLPHVKLFNEYGPTENSVCSTVHQFSMDDQEVLIGKPISNCQCYVLSEDLQLLPPGIPGELYLGGAGLARGYINNPQLTNEKFIEVSHLTGTPQRLYKTGDLVKWTSKGELQFIERIDNQVKIRGFRIELGEIEYQLLKHPMINEAVVIPGEDEHGNKYLCAYVVSKFKISAIKIKEFLAKSLPEYMVPAYYVLLERLPLTLNGKVDKKALPKPEFQRDVMYEPPHNEVEKFLVNIWQEILEKDKIGINDNLFDIGGDSLAVIQALTMCYTCQWNLKAQDFYKYKTIKELACYILNPGKYEEDRVDFIESETKVNSPNQLLVRKQVSEMRPTGKRKIKKVLLTGVTGYLGIHLLGELLQFKDRQVYTLVRGANPESAKKRLLRLISFYYPRLNKQILKRKIKVVNGDITKNKLGLSDADYEQLYLQVDTVVHAAAIVKHYGDYRQFEEVNVKGSQNICEFSQNKYLIHISTTSVSGDFDPRNQGLQFDENTLDVGQYLGDNYYVQSKLAAEKIVHRYFREGLDGVIIRVGNLTGRFKDGHFQTNIHENKFYQILKSIIILGIIPDSLINNQLEFTPVDLCSKAIMKIAKLTNSSGKTFHLFNHYRLNMAMFVEMLNKLGYQIDVVEERSFYQILSKLATTKFGVKLLSGLIPDFKDGKLNYGPYVHVDSTSSLEVLQKNNFEWPQIDITYIRKLFRYMQSVEFLKTTEEKPVLRNHNL